MSKGDLGGAAPVPPAVQEIIALDQERVADLWSYVDDFAQTPIKAPEAHAIEKILKVGGHVGVLEGCGGMYLRSVESMTHHQLDEGVNSIEVFNAMEQARGALKRSMVGMDFEGDPSLASLYAGFRHDYLPRLKHRAQNVPYDRAFSRSLAEGHTDRDVKEAVAIGVFAGSAVLMPVVEASSELFREILIWKAEELKANDLGYFRSNLLSCSPRPRP